MGYRPVRFALCVVREFERLSRDIRMLSDPRNFLGNAGRRENQINAPCRHGASRHRVVFGRIVLRKRDSTCGFDRFQSKRAVVGCA